MGHHTGEFEIVLDGTGGFAFISADGRNLSAPHQRLANAHTRPLEDEHADLAPDAATTRWDGQRLDRPYAISVLAQRRQTGS